MPEIIADMPSRSCYRLFPRSGIEESQRLGPDLFSPRARTRAGTRGSTKCALRLSPHAQRTEGRVRLQPVGYNLKETSAADLLQITGRRRT